MRFSIIIPAYNCEGYISASIESALKQSINSKEIIIINDGSTDSTREICLGYCERYPFINLIDKENSGVSETRNLGLENANGEYIVFLDADDELCDDALEKYESVIVNENSPDIILSNYCLKRKEKCRNVGEMCNVVVENQDRHFADNVLNFYRNRGNQYGNLRTIWAKVFSKKLLENIRFNKQLKIGEDMLFFLDCVFRAKRIVSISDVTYVYRINESSVMQSKKWEKIHNNLAYYELVKKTIASNNYQNDLFALWLEIYESEWFDLIDSDNPFLFKYKTLCEYRKNHNFQRYTKSKQCLSKVEKLYIMAIKYRMILFWMLLIKVKCKRNKKRFTEI